MRRTALLTACLLAATPALAQQRTLANPLTGSAASPVFSGGNAPAPSGVPAAAPRASSTAGVTGANQFTTEAAAQAHCPGASIVWGNPRSKAYHARGDRYFGHTRTGAYMCQRDADAAGLHATGPPRTAEDGTKVTPRPART